MSEPPETPKCEVCEMYRMEDARWILESHIHGLHQELAAKDAEIAELRGFLSTLDECLRVLRGHLEAALARKEGKP